MMVKETKPDRKVSRVRWPCLKTLVATDLSFKVIAFVFLTPLVGWLLRCLIAASGREFLSDLEILYFLLGPAGWIAAVGVGGMWLAIVALEQAALLGILACAADGRRLGVAGALWVAASHAWPVLRLTARIVVGTAIAALPFVFAAGLVYAALLREHDINFYLKQKPPEFRWALAIGAGIGVALAAVCLRLFSGWLMAIPMVLFENVNPSVALRISARRSRGRRRSMLSWIVVWLLATILASAMATGLVGLVGRWLVPGAGTSLHWLTLAIGLTLTVWILTGLAVNLLSSIGFAWLLFEQYRKSAPENSLGWRQAIPEDSEAGKLHVRHRTVAFLGIGASLVLAVFAGRAAIQSVRIEDDVQIMAHRGSSHDAPENTLAAIRRAIEDGADWVEFDVQESSDGEVIVLHDSDFMRVGGNSIKIWNASLDDTQTIDIGSWFAPEFRSERAPTLAEVLTICKDKIKTNIELKYYGHDERLEERVAELIEAAGMVDQAMTMSLEISGIKKMKSVRPAWRTGLLMSASAGDLTRLPAEFIAVNAAFASRSLIRQAHDAGKDVYVWTVNDAPTMSVMMSRGVDGLLTDRPALAREVLAQRAQLSTLERLLLELGSLLGVAPEIGDP